MVATGRSVRMSVSALSVHWEKSLNGMEKPCDNMKKAGQGRNSLTCLLALVVLIYRGSNMQNSHSSRPLYSRRLWSARRPNQRSNAGSEAITPMRHVG